MARKMFKTVEESIELEKTGVPAETGFEYVFNCEEVDLDYFDIHGDTEAQLAVIRENSNYNIKLQQNGDDSFDEFTVHICEAYPET